ncbi:MAG: ribose 5-phosphate isomerase A [Candidatus Korarchaeota archaeon]|nr:ribose 5-phosphate isomerase A [Thermoproteota archaeon]MCR8454831.1 ribose 5-phosphate isomerase A [Thermoproteota archaeon]MCR8462722.1 ribose 5-phosphate isomerase A [Thermoproteota archaeon]MCR8470342.1 ribose 5-phosphate isomerase A [Thermoproteota archaeon]MCR8471688.1 ribose 5-phosphate isomerase A [Thermoproteota archaeon]
MVANTALKYIRDGMILGIGSGSTVREFIDLLSKLSLQVKCIPTSYDTELALRSRGLNTISLLDAHKIDLAIDGADSVFLDKRVIIKGHGGAFLREKIVDYLADEFIVIITEEKLERVVPVPVEVLPFAYSKFMLNELSKYGNPQLRSARDKLGPVVTDNGNWIIDIDIQPNLISRSLEIELKSIPGVIESGVFVRDARILVARKDGKVEEKTI